MQMHNLRILKIVCSVVDIFIVIGVLEQGLRKPGSVAVRAATPLGGRSPKTQKWRKIGRFLKEGRCTGVREDYLLCGLQL